MTEITYRSANWTPNYEDFNHRSYEDYRPAEHHTAVAPSYTSKRVIKDLDRAANFLAGPNNAFLAEARDQLGDEYLNTLRAW